MPFVHASNARQSCNRLECNGVSIPLALFCKSYRNDVRRAKRLAASVARYNLDNLPVYLAVPADDLALFRGELAEFPVTLVSDDDIVTANPRHDPAAYARLDGGKTQQVVKAEFWRFIDVENYICLDSDCYFIRPFRMSDFLAPDGVAFTVMHESKSLLAFAGAMRLAKIAANRGATCRDLMTYFGRTGRLWDFGPVPVVWSSRVWRDLDDKFLKPRHQTVVDAIAAHPAELSLYGEALLAFKSIPLYPIEPLFRCYHYEEEYYFWLEAGETDETLRPISAFAVSQTGTRISTSGRSSNSAACVAD